MLGAMASSLPFIAILCVVGAVVLTLCRRDVMSMSTWQYTFILVSRYILILLTFYILWLCFC